MTRKPTINDIARLAGVSKATVSRVLNHKPDVDATTRKHIWRIVEEQAFVPSITAAGLARGRSRLIGVLTPSFTWPFTADVMRGVAEIIETTSYELVLYSINDGSRESDKADVINRILVTKLVSGLLVIYPGPASGHVARLHKQGFPVVAIDDQEPSFDVPRVDADNCSGAYKAVRHLIALGHRRIAHIQGPLKYLCTRERYQGYCQALEEEGLIPDPELIVEGNFLTVGGQEAASKLFSLPPEKRPTAIFAANDLMAYGVLGAAEACGLRIPEDVALVGFDDISSSSLIRPTLTTVRQPFAEMGQHGMKLLLSMIEASRFIQDEALFDPFSAGRVGDKSVHIQVSTSLVVRASCGSHLPFLVSSLNTQLCPGSLTS